MAGGFLGIICAVQVNRWISCQKYEDKQSAILRKPMELAIVTRDRIIPQYPSRPFGMNHGSAIK